MPGGACGIAGLRTLPPRENGGNFDVKQLTKGSKLFLPVYNATTPFPFQLKPANNVADDRVPQGCSSGTLSVAMCDGSVRGVSSSVANQTWLLACDPNDGLVLPSNW